MLAPATEVVANNAPSSTTSTRSLKRPRINSTSAQELLQEPRAQERPLQQEAPAALVTVSDSAGGAGEEERPLGRGEESCSGSSSTTVLPVEEISCSQQLRGTDSTATGGPILDATNYTTRAARRDASPAISAVSSALSASIAPPTASSGPRPAAAPLPSSPHRPTPSTATPTTQSLFHGFQPPRLQFSFVAGGAPGGAAGVPARRIAGFGRRASPHVMSPQDPSLRNLQIAPGAGGALLSML